MNKTAETQKKYMTATGENTVFLTVAAYSDHELRTAVLRKSAEDYGVPLVIRDRGEPWLNFYHNKIKRLSEHLKQLHDKGKHFAFFLDCRDVVFIEPVDVILAKFNALYDGRVIFNKDAPGEVWPSHKDYLTRAVEEAMGNKYARINSGMYAGETEKILMIQHHAMTLRQELHEGCPRPGILTKLFQEIGTRHSNDDQHLYQICLTYYPELFHIDCDKELFAVLKSYPQDIREHSGDPNRHDVINNAAIIHSPWMAHGEKWNDWVMQNRWER